jgi:DNA-binding transcriptional LysR family regulator
MINFRLIRHLWLFNAVAEERNFSRAAKRLGMSQPPLTDQIKVLEHALKIKLFERSRRGAQLTPAGAAILPAVQKFVQQLEQLEFAVKEGASGQKGTLTVGAISTALLNELPLLLDRLRAAHPDLTVAVKEIDSVDAVPMLNAGDIDIAFARLEGELGPHIRTLALADDRLAVALPNSHRLASATRIKLSTLAEEDFVMFARHVSPVYFDALTSVCLAHGFSPRVLHEVRSVASQVAFVGCGQGIALVPATMKSFAPDNVVVRSLTERIRVVTTAMAWNAARDNPLIEQVLTCLPPKRVKNAEG